MKFDYEDFELNYKRDVSSVGSTLKLDLFKGIYKLFEFNYINKNYVVE
jgi:hypothetical protein